MENFRNPVYGDPERIQYGSTDAEQLDIYTPNREKTLPKNSYLCSMVEPGVLVTVSWKKCLTFCKFVESGMIFIAPDYQLVTDANGSLYPMVDQLRNAVVWTYQNAAKYEGDPDRIFLSGHSAGGHLGGVLITTDWTEYGLPADVIKGAFLSSGMYDLYPVSLSSRNEYVEFTDKMVEEGYLVLSII